MDTVLISMFIMRLFSSLLELIGAILFLKFKRVEVTLRINAILGLIGPAVFTLVSFLGIHSLAGKVSLKKLIIILAGVILVLIGTATK